MKPVTLDWLAAACGGSLTGGGAGVRVTRVGTDSRDLRAGDVFVALVGERFDGHDFVAEAASRGAAAVVVSRECGAAVPQIRVADPLAALQRLASEYRATLSIPVIAVAGSNGKTSTKEMCAVVAGVKFVPQRTRGNLNNHIGVPLTLLSIDAEHTAAVVEVGTNHPGEIAELSALVRPTHAVLTNIGAEHLEFLGDEAGVAREEGALLEGLPPEAVAVLNADDAWTPELRTRTRARVLTAGGAESADVRVENWRAAGNGQLFDFVSDGARVPCDLPLPGRHMAGNAALAVAVGRELGVDVAAAAQALHQVTVPGARMRLSRREGITLIDDSYNANPSSMRAALDELALSPGRTIAVLGTMGELGPDAAGWHTAVASHAGARAIDLLVGVGPFADAYAAGAPSIVRRVPDAAAAVEYLSGVLHAGDTVLLKASRSARFERIAAGLGFDAAGGAH
jgi:UDP-N-acetylmuramoyl-tripeptide--D-alanyl-D-alanine ligase